MPTIPQRIASAFTILFGRYGDVTDMARDRQQSGYGQELWTEAVQAAGFSLMPSMKTVPFTTSASSGDPFNDRQPFDADSISL